LLFQSKEFTQLFQNFSDYQDQKFKEISIEDLSGFLKDGLVGKYLQNSLINYIIIFTWK